MKITKNTRIYIAGCGGMLGEAVYDYFCKKSIVKATDIDVNTDWLEYADVRNYSQIYDSINNFNPHIIINLAALTDLEFCEENQENAWQTNALGTENLALIANNKNAEFVYISTAGIFDGKKDVYNDFDKPNPLSVYAKSKYYGESYVRQTLKKYFIFRAGWMMGGFQKDKKFINLIYKQIVEGKKVLYVVNDKLGTPTYTKSFSNGMFNVIESDLYGLYNQVCTGDCSRYDVAVEFVKLLGLNNEIKVLEVNSDFFAKKYFAPRPFSEKLINMKLISRNLNYMPHWKDALKDYSNIFIDDLKRRR